MTGTPVTQLNPQSSRSNRIKSYRHLTPWRGVGVATVLALWAVGCAPTPKPVPGAALVSPPAFVVQWADDLKIPHPDDDPITAVFVREDRVFVYTKDGKSSVVNRSTGQTIHVDDVPAGASGLHPPVLLKEWIIYPTTTALEVFDRRGVYLRSIAVQGSVASDAVGDGRSNVYVAVEIPGSTRVCRYDMTKLANQPPPPLGQRYPIEEKRYEWALQAFHGGIPAAPAFFADVVYIAGTDGLVFAVSAEDRSPVWPIEQENTPTQGIFDARGPIVANLSVDDSGLYVPEFYNRLYCINRISGQVKWQYTVTSPPLDTPAIVMGDTVYIRDAGLGIVALDKVEPPSIPGRPRKAHFNRDPRWASKEIEQILAQDDHYTFATQKSNSIVALDKKTGEYAFASKRNDFVSFATNTKDATIYAATKDGQLIAIKAVTLPGIIGELARTDAPADPVAMAASPGVPLGRINPTAVTLSSRREPTPKPALAPSVEPGTPTAIMVDKALMQK